MDANFLGLRHVALNVRDLKRSVEFYRKVFGMELEWMPDDRNAYLTSGSDNLALHQVDLQAEKETEAAQKLDHIGFVVRGPEDVDSWSERLESQGVALVQRPRTHRDGARSLYLHDPDGVLIQLIYHPPLSDRSR